MMGPEHYRRAEALMAYIDHRSFHDVDDAGRVVEAYQDDAENTTSMLRAAQVHATLALVAATAAGQATAYDGDEDHTRSRGWAGVA